LDKCSVGEWEERSCLVSNSQAAYIASCVWNNLYNLHYECDKVRNYCIFHDLTSIEQEQLDLLLYKQAEHDSFKVLDTMLTEPAKALWYIKEAQDNNQNEFEFPNLNMISEYIAVKIWQKS
jgi:DNA polymerase III delta subunit